MALTISVSNDNDQPFHPGSMVLGVVKLVTHKDQTIGDLSISFRGRTSVLLVHSYGDMTTSRKDYKSEAYLFSQQINLYNSKYTHRKGSYAWPFAFRIPLSASRRVLPPGSKDFFTSTRPWRGDGEVGEHPLPPNMTYHGPFICYVQYELQATLSQPCRNPVSPVKSLSAVRQIHIQPVATRQAMDAGRGDDPYVQHRHTITCSVDDPLHPHPRKLSLAALLGFQTQRPEAPRSQTEKVVVSVRMPSRITPEEQVALSVRVAAAAVDTPKPSKAGQQETETVSNPEVSPSNDSQHTPHPNATEDEPLTGTFKLSLIQHMHVRAGCHHPSSTKRIFVRKGVYTLRVSRQQPVSIDLAGTVALRNMSGTTTSITPNLIPSFSTYNIACSYSWELSLKTVYRGSKSRFRLRDVPVQVLSPPRQQHGEGIGTSNIGAVGARDGGEFGDEAWIVPPTLESGVDGDRDDNGGGYYYAEDEEDNGRDGIVDFSRFSAREAPPPYPHRV